MPSDIVASKRTLRALMCHTLSMQGLSIATVAEGRISLNLSLIFQKYLVASEFN